MVTVTSKTPMSADTENRCITPSTAETENVRESYRKITAQR
jgi:hypothetical protein